MPGNSPVVADPTRTSPNAKLVAILDILRIFVSASQSLTLAVHRELWPFTTSFKKKLPVPTPDGAAIVITGAVAYPNPALVSLTSLMVPAALTCATAVAFAVDRPDGDVDMDTTGGDVYLLPPV